MRRTADFLVGLAVAVLIHLLGVRLVPGFSGYVDVFAVLVVFNALDGNPLAGMIGGTVSGLAHDTLSGGLFGLFGLAGTLTGYAVAKLVQLVVVERASTLLLVFAAGAALYQAAAVLLSLALFADPALPKVGSAAIRVTASGAAGLAAFGVVSYGRRSLRRWRRTRHARLRLR